MITYLPANELHSDLEIETAQGWRRVISASKIRHRVAVKIETGLVMNFPANMMFKTRLAGELDEDDLSRSDKAQALVDSGLADDLADAREQLEDMGEL